MQRRKQHPAAVRACLQQWICRETIILTLVLRPSRSVHTLYPGTNEGCVVLAMERRRRVLGRCFATRRRHAPHPRHAERGKWTHRCDHWLSRPRACDDLHSRVTTPVMHSSETCDPLTLFDNRIKCNRRCTNVQPLLRLLSYCSLQYDNMRQQCIHSIHSFIHIDANQTSS